MTFTGGLTRQRWKRVVRGFRVRTGIVRRRVTGGESHRRFQVCSEICQMSWCTNVGQRVRRTQTESGVTDGVTRTSGECTSIGFPKRERQRRTLREEGPQVFQVRV